jgi:hypothetical protein
MMVVVCRRRQAVFRVVSSTQRFKRGIAAVQKASEAA